MLGWPQTAELFPSEARERGISKATDHSPAAAPGIWERSKKLWWVKDNPGDTFGAAEAGGEGLRNDICRDL